MNFAPFGRQADVLKNFEAGSPEYKQMYAAITLQNFQNFVDKMSQIIQKFGQMSQSIRY
jgi:hypothetical protein